jgi:hypothetical protein
MFINTMNVSDLNLIDGLLKTWIPDSAASCDWATNCRVMEYVRRVTRARASDAQHDLDRGRV